jgi:transposase
MPCDKPFSLRLFECEKVDEKPVDRPITVVTTGGRRSVCVRTVPVYVYEVDDRAAESLCIAMLSQAKVADDVTIADIFGCHRNTVGRLRRRLVAQGLAGVVPARRGPKRPYKVTPEVVAIVREESTHLSVPALVRSVKERTGVSLSQSHVRRLARESRPVAKKVPLLDAPAEEVTQPSVESNSLEPTEVEPGKPETGKDVLADPASFDPPVVPPKRVSGRYMGLALYFPAIAALGLVRSARHSYALPRSTIFGVRAVALSLLFMTLLRKPTVESAKHLRRAEFGALIGTDRAPCVKTLRRKLETMAAQAKAAEFGRRLARHWVEEGIVSTRYLYVDGHVKEYSGERAVQEYYSSKRRVATPGVHTYFVGDLAGRPLLYLSEPLSANLAHAMPGIVAAIREVLGKGRFTVIFDRGGFDHRLFKWLDSERIGFVTYQRGRPDLPESSFSRKETRFEGRRLRFDLAEDMAWVNGKGPWRRVVVRAKNGHQLPIITNLDVPAPRLTCLMRARWRQENLFKYMVEHYGLDHLISHGADPADPKALIPNPEITRLERKIAELRQQATRMKASLGQAALEKGHRRSVRGLKIAQRGAVGRLRALEVDITKLKAARKALPSKVTIAESATGRVVLRGEHKAIVDRVKITAYNAEEWLLERLERHYQNPNDVRDLLRSFAELPGDIRTTSTGVTVTLHPPNTPIHRRALQGLIDDLNAADTTFPGTDIPVHYRLRRRRETHTVHQNRTAA